MAEVPFPALRKGHGGVWREFADPSRMPKKDFSLPAFAAPAMHSPPLLAILQCARELRNSSEFRAGRLSALPLDMFVPRLGLLRSATIWRF